MRREWLLRAGPFEVERAAAISERERDELRAELAAYREQVTRLDAEVAALQREPVDQGAGRTHSPADGGGHDAAH